jgi:hypothetical protein
MGITNPKPFSIETRDRIPACGVAAQACVVPPLSSQLTAISEAGIEIADPRHSAAMAQPILFDAETFGQSPVNEFGSRDATSAPARALFSTVICV